MDEEAECAEDKAQRRGSTCEGEPAGSQGPEVRLLRSRSRQWSSEVQCQAEAWLSESWGRRRAGMEVAGHRLGRSQKMSRMCWWTPRCGWQMGPWVRR